MEIREHHGQRVARGVGHQVGQREHREDLQLVGSRDRARITARGGYLRARCALGHGGAAPSSITSSYAASPAASDPWTRTTARDPAGTGATLFSLATLPG